MLSRPRNECDSALREMGSDLMLQNGNKRATDGDKLSKYLDEKYDAA